MKQKLFLVIGIVVAQSSPTFDDFFGDDPPPPSPPRLQRTSRIQTTMHDPCLLLCVEYTASGRGEGYDLCDHPERSFCIPTGDRFICRNLYWSATDSGQRGLIYVRNETELTMEEREHPLSCQDAEVIYRDAQSD
jgi:hypothetical protein